MMDRTTFLLMQAAIMSQTASAVDGHRKSKWHNPGAPGSRVPGKFKKRKKVKR